MRYLLVSLALVFFALMAVATFPGAEEIVRPQSRGPIVGEWIQESAADFQSGSAEGVAIASQGSLALLGSQGEYLSSIRDFGASFNAVGARWSAQTPEGTGLWVEVRSSADRHSWSDWQVLAADNDAAHEEASPSGETDAAHEQGSPQASLAFLPPGRYLQYRVLFSSADSAFPPSLDSIALVAIDSRPGPSVEKARSMARPFVEESGVARPSIIPRAGWGAREDLTTLEPKYEHPRAIIVHHTVTGNFAPDPAVAVRAVFYYHAVTLGWGDIGYNYLIDWQGNVYEGRRGGEGVVGGHARQYNRGSIGIALLGDFSHTSITPEMERALVELMAWAADRYGIDPRGSAQFEEVTIPNIVGHRDVLQTSCPGAGFYAELPRLRDLVWAQLSEHGPRVILTQPSDEVDYVAGSVLVSAESPSPALERLEFYLDEEKVAEGPSPLEWTWDSAAQSDGEHLLRLIGYRQGGKPTELRRTIQVDNTAPQGTIEIGDGRGFANSPSVVLHLEGEDAGSGVAEVQFASGPAEFGSWEAYASEFDLTLSGQEGSVEIAARLRDRVRNVSEPIAAKAILDFTAAQWEPALVPEADGLWITVSDALAGIDPATAQFALSEDGAQWGEWAPAQAVPLEGGEYRLGALGSFAKRWIRFQVSDLAGNLSLSPAFPLSGGPPLDIEPQPLPDLLVEAIEIESELRVIVRNASQVPVGDGFWVQLSIASLVPLNAPLGWEVHWHVLGLDAGGTATLSIQEADPYSSTYPGVLPPGGYRLVARVDALNPDDPRGMIVEANEDNNTLGPIDIQVRPAEPELLGRVRETLWGFLDALRSEIIELLGGLPAIQLPGVGEVHP